MCICTSNYKSREIRWVTHPGGYPCGEILVLSQIAQDVLQRCERGPVLLGSVLSFVDRDSQIGLEVLGNQSASHKYPMIIFFLFLLTFPPLSDSLRVFNFSTWFIPENVRLLIAANHLLRLL